MLASTIHLPQRVLDRITEHARAAAPQECCGLLVGSPGQIVEGISTGNAAADPTRRYKIAPEAYFAQIKRLRSTAADLSVIGAYHSHPRGRAVPSATDLAEAFSDFLFLIVGPVNDSEPLDARAYQLATDTMEPVTVMIGHEHEDGLA